MSEKFDDVSKLIDRGKLDSAQKVLDARICDDAEWHYLQSRVYYNRGWFLDCKRHLECACELDPDNQEYKETLDKLLKQGSIELDPKEKRKNEKRLKRAVRRSKRSSSDGTDLCCEACVDCFCEGCCGGLCEGILSGC